MTGTQTTSSDSAAPAEPLSAADLAEILDDVAALVTNRPQEDFDDDAVLDAAIEVTNALGDKLTVAARRRRLSR